MRHANRLRGVFDHPPAIASGQRRVVTDLVEREQQVAPGELEGGVGIVEVWFAEAGEVFNACDALSGNAE